MTQARWFAPPVVQIDVAFAEAMPALENVMLHAAYAPALVKTKVAFPPETVWGELRGTTSPPDAPMQEEVVVAAIWCELSPVTVAPFTSCTATTMVLQLASVFVPVGVHVPT